MRLLEFIYSHTLSPPLPLTTTWLPLPLLPHQAHYNLALTPSSPPPAHYHLAPKPSHPLPITTTWLPHPLTPSLSLPPDSHSLFSLLTLTTTWLSLPLLPPTTHSHSLPPILPNIQPISTHNLIITYSPTPDTRTPRT